MARKRNRNNYRSRRVIPNNANRRLSEIAFIPRSLSPLRLTEDRRLFNPEPFSPARSFSQPRHRLVLPNAVPASRPNRRLSLPSSVAFQAPQRVLVCVRRQIRKEVIHALGKSGAGVKRRHPHRSEFSSVSCR